MLSTVWKAGAAVVNNALGRAIGLLWHRWRRSVMRGWCRTGGGGGGACNRGVVDRCGGPPAARVGAGRRISPIFLPTEPPVSYTEHGVSQWGSLELGQLVSKRA
ncbi:MAG: hypothetical protein R3E42_06645 [Burkholderiaceae bacterium]